MYKAADQGSDGSRRWFMVFGLRARVRVWGFREIAWHAEEIAVFLWSASSSSVRVRIRGSTVY